MITILKGKALMALLLQLILLLFIIVVTPVYASADNPCNDPKVPCCGDRTNQNVTVKTSINIGCKGKGNPIMDALFAIIRFLSDGVGIVVVASIVVGGIQYSASRGDPQASARAVTRIRSAVTALLIFIFAYAFLNYLVPGAILK